MLAKKAGIEAILLCLLPSSQVYSCLITASLYARYIFYKFPALSFALFCILLSLLLLTEGFLIKANAKWDSQPPSRVALNSDSAP